MHKLTSFPFSAIYKIHAQCGNPNFQEPERLISYDDGSALLEFATDEDFIRFNRDASIMCNTVINGYEQFKMAEMLGLVPEEHRARERGYFLEALDHVKTVSVYMRDFAQPILDAIPQATFDKMNNDLEMGMGE